MVHGSYSTYVNHSCRCSPCTEANTAYKTRYVNKNINKNRSYKLEYYLQNQDLVKNRSKDWRFNNKEAYHLSARVGSARRRARVLGAKTFPSVDRHIAKCYGKPCFFCGTPSDTHEHLIPISRGGDHSEGNIVPACMQCNQTKNRRLLIEWRRFNMVKYGSGESISAISFKPVVR
jgi:5-methylcytosine-specific restriction endonuclease McrA